MSKIRDLKLNFFVKVSVRKAINEALTGELLNDNNVFLIGEEVGLFDGAYKVTEGLLKSFGSRRVIDTPISENGFCGLAVGASLSGVKPIVEFMTWSFSYVAFDQIINSAANLRYMSGGQLNLPLVFRGPANGGVGVGATHSHAPHNIYSMVPGLKVVCPSNSYDTKGLLKSSIRDMDPVCFLEHTVLYNNVGLVDKKNYFIPLGKANIKLLGSHITLISYGNILGLCIKAADFVKSIYGLNVEVIDLRTLRPLDEKTILKSVVKTNRVLIVEECKPFCSIASSVAFLIQTKLFYYLDHPIKTVTNLDSPSVYSVPLEKNQLPCIKRLVTSLLRIIY